MLLVFIDETGDVKFKDYLGFSIATINSYFYPSLKTKSQNILLKMGWDPLIEFKGSYLFSATKGCSDVDVEKRIEAARKPLDLNVVSVKRRMQFHYGYMNSSDHRSDFLTHLPPQLGKVLPIAPRSAGKNLISINVDERSDISLDELDDFLLLLL